ncbi:MAG: hypothetical protein GY953_34805, partial [bacterium]|nr:hypothetical protein [bacterium]
MFECRYFALDNDGYEDSGFDEVPVEIESEIRQYDFDEEDEGELADSESAVPEIPAAPVAAAPHDPPRKKPVARATEPAPAKPARAAKKKAPAK